jgi:hypothetical protein
MTADMNGWADSPEDEREALDVWEAAARMLDGSLRALREAVDRCQPNHRDNALEIAREILARAGGSL